MRPLNRLETWLGAIAGDNEPPVFGWPMTRDEIFLRAILEEKTDVPEPNTRRQAFLYKRATGTGSVPEPLTREETFWAAFAGEDVELPEPLKHLEIYIKMATKTEGEDE